jgi:hypothetical protein
MSESRSERRELMRDRLRSVPFALHLSGHMSIWCHQFPLAVRTFMHNGLYESGIGFLNFERVCLALTLCQSS